MMIIAVIGIIATFVGLIGYSFNLKNGPDEEKNLSSITNFYMLVCFTLFVHMYSHFYHLNRTFIELFFGFSITVAAFYLLWSVIMDGGFSKKVNGRIDPLRFRNGILYASVTWLMGKELAFLKLQPFVIPGLILLPVFFVLLYPVMVIKELKISFFYDNFSAIFSNSFLPVLFSGVAITSMAFIPNAYLPIESLAAIIALYVILKMTKATEAFLAD
ncbi:MAG: hypothetical protein ACOC5L_02020 [Halobacteriota archaeon]